MAQLCVKRSRGTMTSTTIPEFGERREQDPRRKNKSEVIFFERLQGNSWYRLQSMSNKKTSKKGLVNHFISSKPSTNNIT